MEYLLRRGKTISRGYKFPYHPGFPDLTPRDFLLWGYFKCRVHYSDPCTLSQLKDEIHWEIWCIDPDWGFKTHLRCVILAVVIIWNIYKWNSPFRGMLSFICVSSLILCSLAKAISYFFPKLFFLHYKNFRDIAMLIPFFTSIICFRFSRISNILRDFLPNWYYGE